MQLQCLMCFVCVQSKQRCENKTKLIYDFPKFCLTRWLIEKNSLLTCSENCFHWWHFSGARFIYCFCSRLNIMRWSLVRVCFLLSSVRTRGNCNWSKVVSKFTRKIDKISIFKQTSSRNTALHCMLYTSIYTVQCSNYCTRISAYSMYMYTVACMQSMHAEIPYAI